MEADLLRFLLDVWQATSSRTAIIPPWPNGGKAPKAGSTLFNGLLQYKLWRDKFIERFAWALKEVYAPDRVVATIDGIADMVRSEMPAEREKFGGTVQGWENTLESMKNFADKRGANVDAAAEKCFYLIRRAD